MVLIIHCILLFFVEVIKLGMVMIGLMEFKLRKRFIFYLLGGVFVLGMASVYALYKNENAYIYTSTYLDNILLVLVIITVLGGVSGRRKILTTAVSYASVSLLDIVLSGMILVVFNIQVDKVIKNYLFDVLANSLSIVIIVLLILLKCKIKGRVSISFFSIKPKYIIMVLFGIVGCCFYIAPIQILGITLKQSSNNSLIAFGVSISGIVFILICVGLVIINDSKNHYRNLVDMNQKLIEQQKEYYRILIEKEEYTKRFRHDINNHIYCMQHLCELQRYDNLSLYLNEMQVNMEKLNIDLQTGNDIVNIVVNDINAKNKTEDISILWRGILPQNIKITSMDLCTIFSNLFINSVEAVKQISNKEKRYIDVQIKSLQNNIVIRISNPVTEKVLITNQRLITTKSNKEKHGLGSINVAQCVKKYNGDLKYSSTEEEFIVELVFPDITIE